MLVFLPFFLSREENKSCWKDVIIQIFQVQIKNFLGDVILIFMDLDCTALQGVGSSLFVDFAHLF